MSINTNIVKLTTLSLRMPVMVIGVIALLSGFGLSLLHAPVAHALSTAELQKCYDDWDNTLIPDAPLGGPAGEKLREKFAASGCEQTPPEHGCVTYPQGDKLSRVQCWNPKDPFNDHDGYEDHSATDAGCNAIQTAIIKCDDSDHNPVVALLLVIINFIAAGVGILVAGGIIWGAINYIQSNGNAQKAQQGISIIVNAVIGLVVFLFMYAIIQYLVPGGLFH